MKKLILSGIISIILLFCLSFFNVTASAEKINDEFFSYLVQETSEFKNEVDISEYINRYEWDLDDLKEQIKYFYLSEPELFFVGREVRVMYSADMSEVIIKFEYDYSEEEVASMKKKMKKAALKAIGNITDDMSDVEKALAVHDYLILNTSYDHSESNYSAYDCLVKKSAVCQGYSLAYLYIMRNLLDIPCSIVYTDTQDHAWNYIKIGKYWYHVDLTADDPAFTAYGGTPYDGGGEVRHNNFMMSDTAFYESSDLHRDWQTMGKPKAKSTKYDNYFWQDTSSAVFKIDGLWYFTALDKNSPGVNYKGGKDTDIYTDICTYDFETGVRKTIYTINDNWTVYRDPKTGKIKENVSWYTKSYSKIVPVNGQIYFNSSEKVYRYNPETGVIKKAYTLKKENKQIFSIVPYGKNSFRLIYKNDLSYENKYIKLKIS